MLRLFFYFWLTFKFCFCLNTRFYFHLMLLVLVWIWPKSVLGMYGTLVKKSKTGELVRMGFFKSNQRPATLLKTTEMKLQPMWAWCRGSSQENCIRCRKLNCNQSDTAFLFNQTCALSKLWIGHQWKLMISWKIIMKWITGKNKWVWKQKMDIKIWPHISYS